MVSEENIRKEAFRVIYNLINDNKVSGTYVYAGFPNKSPSFPLYAINPFTVSSTSEDYGYDQEYDLSCEIELWCKAKDLKSKIDEMKDNIQHTILSNITTLHANNLELKKEWFDDTNVDSVSFNDEKYHTGAITLRFKLR